MRVPTVEAWLTVSDAAGMDDVAEIIVSDSVDGLFRAHYGRLVRALTVVAGSQDAAADAVQEAFVKAHLRWGRIRRYEDPVGWIRRVAINRLRDDHRRLSRKVRATQRLQTDARPDSFAWTDDNDLAAMIATLPRQQRLALALFYVEGLTVADVATALGISEGAVKFHLHQGRERLRGSYVAGQASDR